MIEMTVINTTDDHLLLSFARPGRVELSVVHGKVLLHVYEGAETDIDQDPLFAYDGNEPGQCSVSSAEPEDIDLDGLTGSCDCGAKYVPADISDHCGECGSCFDHCDCDGGPNPHVRALLAETEA